MTSTVVLGTVTALRQRRRGAALEDAILQAAFEELSEAGYSAFTVEGVAARARTGKASIYRRWPTRGDLILDAASSQLPSPADCGMALEVGDQVSTVDALHGLAVAIANIFNSPAGEVMRSIKCEAQNDPELAHAVDARFAEPRRAAMVALLRRGVARGEVRAAAATELVADVLPAMLTHRVVMQREPITPQVVTDIVDQVLLPLIEPAHPRS